MKIKMIVCDLDRTLLRTDKTISAYTLDVLADCRRRGILFAYATARPRYTMPYLDVAKPDIVISDNGALAVMGKTVIHRVVLDKKLVQDILRILNSAERLGYITASSDAGVLVNFEHDPNDPGWFGYNPILTDFSQEIGHELYKISPEILDDRIVAELKGLPGVSHIPFSGENWCNIISTNVTKWHAVQKVAEHLGIDTAHIAAFGDDYSDIQMLAGCGIGVAVANAIDEVKAAADHICASNDDDGVAKWLEQNLLCG